MSKWILVTMISALISFFSGCSQEVKKFNPKPVYEISLRSNITKKILIKVKMSEKNKNAIICRMNGNVIFLPNKMTYSQYIEDAFRKTLMLPNKLAEEDSKEDSNYNALSITLTKVDFNSAIGKWYINANVKVNNNTSVEIESTTSFETNYFVETVCSNVVGAFDKAVGNFVEEVLSNPKIIANIGV